MEIDEEIVDVSQDWELACDVQQRFMHGAGWNAGLADYSARCRQLLLLFFLSHLIDARRARRKAKQAWQSFAR